MTAGYAASIAAVIADVRRVLQNPAEKVWLVGTSSGTISAVKIAAQYPQTKPKNPWIPRWDRPDLGANSQTSTRCGFVG